MASVVALKFKSALCNGIFVALETCNIWEHVT